MSLVFHLHSNPSKKFTKEMYYQQDLCDLPTATQPTISDDVAIWTQDYLASVLALPH